MKTFPVAVVVSAYRDRMFCPFEDYRQFLDHMVGEKVWFHDIAAARRVIAEHLEVTTKLPATPAPPEKTDSGAGVRYIRSCIKALGSEEVAVTPLPPGTFTTRSLATANTALFR